MQIKISALDTLFFRNGKPFDRGEDNWAESIFPPLPSVIFGAIRTYFYSQNPDKIEELDKNDLTQNLKINRFFLKGFDSTLFPIPLDLVKYKNNGDSKSFLKYNLQKHLSNYPCEYINVLDDNIETPIGFINKGSLNKYLKQSGSEISYIPIERIFSKENKIGIGIDNNTRSTEQSKLYRVGMLRTEDKNENKIEIVVDFDLNGFDAETNLLKLGAETKMSSVVELKNDNKIKDIQLPEIDNNYFKLYFLTPAIFENGWLPDFVNPDNVTGEIGNCKVKLITAFVGKAFKIGGFDIKEGEPKNMYSAIPAGTVYYFKILECENNEQIIEKLHHKNISDIMSEQGYGHTIVSSLTPNTNEKKD